MSSKKILYVSQEIMPYLAESHISKIARNMPQLMQENGYEIRTFLPRYGCINERRNQLHEVIRLSGMNIIIDDNDHQLIIKVASIPSARVQIYFIDNEEYFQRKCVLKEESGEFCEDNDERGIFFARGVLETVKKLRWSPDAVHCHGWFAGFIAMYIKRVYADDPLFANTKVILSLYDDEFTQMLDENIKKKIEDEGIAAAETEVLSEPTYLNFMKFLSIYADAVVFAQEGISDQVKEFFAASGIETLDCPDSDNYVEKYNQLYEKILA